MSGPRVVSSTIGIGRAASVWAGESAWNGWDVTLKLAGSDPVSERFISLRAAHDCCDAFMSGRDYAVSVQHGRDTEAMVIAAREAVR